MIKTKFMNTITNNNHQMLHPRNIYLYDFSLWTKPYDLYIHLIVPLAPSKMKCGASDARYNEYK